MHIDTTMRRPNGVSPAAGDAVAHMLALAALFPRQDVERAIDAMIAALDASDGDPDSEDGDNDCCGAGDDDPKRCGTKWCEDADREGLTWPERDTQPGTMAGGLGAYGGDHIDDMEPWFTPPHWPEGGAA